MNQIDLTGRVAIVTGAGGGIGRAHALLLAQRGARVVVNDLGGARDGSGYSGAAETVAAEIEAGGGSAMASRASVTDEAAIAEMIDSVLDRWDRIDILVNNAGVLRDRTFAKMTIDDFRYVVDVHLMGSVLCTKALWQKMRDQAFGRIVFTTSSSGLFGNFGQSNYGAAKMALVGLMQTLGLEGEKYNVRVNCIAPSAATRMTEDVMPAEMLAALSPDQVASALLPLIADDAPNRAILAAGGGSVKRAYITLTSGCYVGDGPHAGEEIAAVFDTLSDRSGDIVPRSGGEQSAIEYAHSNASA